MHWIIFFLFHLILLSVTQEILSRFINELQAKTNQLAVDKHDLPTHQKQALHIFGCSQTSAFSTAQHCFASQIMTHQHNKKVLIEIILLISNIMQYTSLDLWNPLSSSQHYLHHKYKSQSCYYFRLNYTLWVETRYELLLRANFIVVFKHLPY